VSIWYCGSRYFLKYLFYLEMHLYNFFYFLKLIFNITIPKQFKNIKKLILKKNKILWKCAANSVPKRFLRHRLFFHEWKGWFFYVFLYHFNVLISKINFKNYFDTILNKKNILKNNRYDNTKRTLTQIPPH